MTSNLIPLMENQRDNIPCYFCGEDADILIQADFTDQQTGNLDEMYVCNDCFMQHFIGPDTRH